MEYTELDLNNVCRTCINVSLEMKPLDYRDSESSKEEPRLDEMLKTCASVQINNEDGLPKSICRTCLIQLKNAYSFKQQCEKTDLFFRNYLKNFKKKSTTKEIVTDFTSNFTNEINSTLSVIGRTNDDGSIENIKQEPESHSRESREKDVDYVRLVDGNVTIYECRMCPKIFYTLEGLMCHKQIHTDNNKELCLVTKFDGNTHTFSNQSDDGRGGDDLLVDGETATPEVEVSENNDQEKIDEIGGITNDFQAEEDPLKIVSEKMKIEEDIYRVTYQAEPKEEVIVDNGYECESDVSRHPEDISMKQTLPKTKRGRGKPRDHPASLKSTGRPRGRYQVLELKAKSAKNEMGNFSCPQCKEVFTNKTCLEKHAVKHDDLRIHECDVCNKKFRWWDNLKQHKLLHVEGKPYLCMTCGTCFKRKDYLQKHMKSHLRTETHSCNLCQAVFDRAINLVKHKLSKHNIDEKITDEKRYKCQYCQKDFATEKYRDLHTKFHFGDRKFQCRTCEKTFIAESHLTKHMKFHDDSSKKFLCSECGRRFIGKHGLVHHMMRHRGEKPFECKFCGKAFTRMGDLTVHERNHTGEKTHFCVTCGKGFGRACTLTIHMRTHTGEKPYCCTFCDATFAQCNDLKAHIRKHTGERFQCELCPRSFMMGHLLKQHKRVVHGLNIASNKRRLQPINKLNSDDPPPVTDSDPVQSQQIEVSELKQEEKNDIM